MNAQLAYDGIILLGFGGPTEPGRSLEFVRRVTAGRATEERIVEIARHYDDLGGISPYNARTLKQAAALRERLAKLGHSIPVSVGYRFWEPFIMDTLSTMHTQGCRRILGVILSAFQCSASWEVYQDAVSQALSQTKLDLSVDYLESIGRMPCYAEACADRIREVGKRAKGAAEAELIFTAHSVPEPVARTAPYAEQFVQAAATIAHSLGRERFRIAYQSGAPGKVPWLGPDISAAIRTAAEEGAAAAIVAPIGFLCDHVEVLFDLDVTARAAASAARIKFLRARTVESHAKFIDGLADAIVLRLAGIMP